MAPPDALSTHGLSKQYGSVVACDGIDLTIAVGEIRALLGENGAGKSTLMRMLYGLARPDHGWMALGGRSHAPRSARDAIDAGMGMVHQELMLVPSLTVAENVVLGNEPRRRGLFDRHAANEATAETASRFGLGIDPRSRVNDLSIGLRQRVEILKILHRDARVLILDEPTAVLDPAERDSLFVVLRKLAAAGRTILFITHKLDEVRMLADRATVLRHGRKVASVEVSGTSSGTLTDDLCRLMIGRSTTPIARVDAPDSDDISKSRPLLAVRNLAVTEPEGRGRVAAVDFTVHAGEIVGIAGVAGNGQRALVEAIAGVRTASAGSIHLCGDDDMLHDVAGTSLAARRRAGLAWIAEDRAGRGLALVASLADNLLIGVRRQADLFPRGVLNRGRARRHVARLLDRFAVKAKDPSQPTNTLSGGNQQKLVAARELDAQPRLLLAEQPSRGIDVAAAATLHDHLRTACNTGAGVLLVSSEIDEILALSHRVLVMRNGRIVGALTFSEATEERIGMLMTGGAAA